MVSMMLNRTTETFEGMKPVVQPTNVDIFQKLMVYFV